MTHVIERLFGPLARRWAWVRTGLRVHERFGEVHGGYLASAVTLTAFLSLFPLLLVAVALLGFVSANNTDVAASIISHLGLTGDAARMVNDAVSHAEDTRAAALGLGTLGLLWSGLGLVATLQHAFNAVWQVPARGMKDKVVGLGWLTGAGLIMLLSIGITSLTNVLPGALASLALLVGFVVNLGLWLWSMRVLQNHAVDIKSLLPGAVTGAVGFEILKVLGAIWLPRAVARSSALYGSIGTVFAILAWLLFFGRIVVYASVVNVVRWEEDHGTVTAEIELPKLPGEVPVTTTRSGEAVETQAS
jgi:membrane protein